MRNTGYETYLQPAFLICVAVLAIAGSGMSIAIKSFGVYLKKTALPLKKSLDLLDEKALAPYKVVEKGNIENEQKVKALGTENYIQWILEDPNAAADSAVRKCSLFVTYYELPDPRVVHVPDECYMGVGYQRLAFAGVTLKVMKYDGEEKLGARCVVFAGAGSSHWRGDIKFPVLYLFNVNGDYAGSREEARIILNRNLFGKYSYFSKVEWKFFNTRFGQTIYPSKEEAITAGEKLLAVVLPVLKREHWPDWPVVSDE
ncbi:MAG: hypothetical protein ACYS83_04535 [Planctomycetota bacterium]|jgi:hypothetical protein